MDIQTIAIIATAVTSLLGMFFGARYLAVKKAAKEIKDVLVVVVDAFEDDKIDSIETGNIIKEATEAAIAVGVVFKKKA